MTCETQILILCLRKREEVQFPNSTITTNFQLHTNRSRANKIKFPTDNHHLNSANYKTHHSFCEFVPIGVIWSAVLTRSHWLDIRCFSLNRWHDALRFSANESEEMKIKRIQWLRFFDRKELLFVVHTFSSRSAHRN